jgi:two-component system, response regulator PdtaR
VNTPTLRALVVEDDRSWQQILSEILTDCGLEVQVVDNLEAAIVALKTQPHRLVAVDLSLSPNDHNNRDGLRVLEAVRRLDPNCCAVLLTGFATVELAVAALTDYGAFTFLRKENFQRAQFREIVYRALASAPQPTPPGLAPIKENDSPARSNPAVALKESTTGKALVVEDDAGWRSILEELLVDAGFEVLSCASFGDALGYLRREKFTLAVVDLSLSGTLGNFWSQNTPSQNLEGYQLLASTRTGGVPTIVVSGVASPEEIERAYAEQSIFAYLEKQAFDRAAFRRAVAEARAAHRDLSELSLLTDREREVLDLLARGQTNKEMAENLFITTNTVKRHLKAIFEKLDVHTRSAAAAKALGERG